MNKLKLFLITTLAITGVMCMAQCPGACLSENNPDSQKTNETPAKSDTKEKQEVKLPTLIELGAKKCIPCKTMAPIIEKLDKEYKGVFNVKFIDVWLPENEAEAKKYKIEIIPTQIFLDKDGKELWRHIDVISEEDILKKWAELGYKFEKKTDNKK